MTAQITDVTTRKDRSTLRSSGNSDFNVAWRKTLRSPRLAPLREQICELRASTRLQPSAIASFKLKLLEGRLEASVTDELTEEPQLFLR
jgi:hypothetical protein